MKPEKEKTAKGNGSKERTELEKKIKELEQKLEEKTKEAQEYYEKWLRAMAELDNLRKRVEKERSDYFKFANEQLVKNLLPVIDNLERALTHAEEKTEINALLEGVKLTLKMMHGCLEKFGVKPVKAEGEKFNPHFHEAVQVEEKDDITEEIVIKELQKGYMLHDRLLRPSLVVVGKPKE